MPAIADDFELVQPPVENDFEILSAPKQDDDFEVLSVPHPVSPPLQLPPNYDQPPTIPPVNLDALYLGGDPAQIARLKQDMANTPEPTPFLDMVPQPIRNAATAAQEKTFNLAGLVRDYTPMGMMGKGEQALIDRYAPKGVSDFTHGAQEGVDETINFFTSPLGIATLGTSALPKAAQVAVSAAFTTQMAKDLPEIYTQLQDAIAKKDWATAGKLTAAGAANLVFVKQGAEHTLSGLEGMGGKSVPLGADFPDRTITTEPAAPKADDFEVLKLPTEMRQQVEPAKNSESEVLDAIKSNRVEPKTAPLATLNDAIGAKLDEIKALLSGNAPKESTPPPVEERAPEAQPAATPSTLDADIAREKEISGRMKDIQDNYFDELMDENHPVNKMHTRLFGEMEDLKEKYQGRKPSDVAKENALAEIPPPNSANVEPSALPRVEPTPENPSEVSAPVDKSGQQPLFEPPKKEGGYEKRQAILDKHTAEVDAALEKSKNPVFKVNEESSEYNDNIDVSANGQTITIMRDKDGTDWTAYGDDDVKVTDTPDKEHAIKEAKDYIKDKLQSDAYKKDDGSDGSPAEMTVYDMSKHLELPKGWELRDTAVSKSSYYWMLKSPSGENYKVRISDHSPSPFREQEFGAADGLFKVKHFSPEEFHNAMSRMEDWLADREKENAPQSEASRTVPDSLKSAGNQIQTESRMVQGERNNAQAGKNVKLSENPSEVSKTPPAVEATWKDASELSGDGNNLLSHEPSKPTSRNDTPQPLRDAVLRGTTVRGILTHLSVSDHPLAPLAENLLRNGDEASLRIKAGIKAGLDRSRWTTEGGNERIEFAPDAPADSLRVLHEIVHALTATKGARYKPLLDLMEQVRPHLDPNEYAFTDKQGREFIAEAMSNPDFQAKLEAIKVGPSTAWAKFKNIVQRLIGIAPANVNMLDQVLKASHEIVKAPREERGGTLMEPDRMGDESDIPTGIRKSIVDRERDERDTAPVQANAKYTFKGRWQEAQDYVSNNPGAREALVDDLIETPRPISGVEPALLGHYRVDARRAYDIAARELIDARKSGDQNRIDAAQVTELALQKKLTQFDQMLRVVGGKSSEGLNLRRFVINNDYSLASMVERASAAKGGESLTPDEIQNVEDMAAEIERSQKELEQHYAESAAADSEMASKRAHEEMVGQAQTPRRPVRKGSSLFGQRNAAVAAAKARLLERGRTVLFEEGKLDPQDLHDYGVIGGGHIADGINDIAEFNKIMVDQFGEGIRRHLPEILERSKVEAEELYAASLEDLKAVRDEIKERVSNGETAGDFGHLIKRLARTIVDAGVRNRDMLIDAVHEGLQKNGVDLTRREVMDAISGYGDYKALSKDESDIALRQMKGEMQQIAKLEDLQKTGKAEKTGVERQTPSDEYRQLAKKVNEYKRKYGITDTDPARQLKSALESRKTYYRNQITDLESQIAAKERFVKSSTPSPTDAELEGLKAKRDEIKKEFDDIFQKPEMTDEQRLQLVKRSLEKSIAEKEAKLASGDVQPAKGQVKRPLDPQLERLAQQRDELNKKIAKARAVPEGQRYADEQQKRLDQINKAIAERKTKLASGDLSSKPSKASRPLSPDLEKARQELERVNKQIQEARDAITPKKSKDEIALGALKTRLSKSIVELERRIAGKDFSKKPDRKTVTPDAEAMNLRVANEKARAKYDDLLEKYRSENRTKGEKFRAGAVKWARVAKLSSLHVFPKLLEAGLIRVITDPVSRVLGQPLRMVPGLAGKAPYELGLSMKAETANVVKLLTSGRAALEKLRTGRTNIDYLAGKTRAVDKEMLNFIGNSHGMIKEPVRQGVFARSVQLRTEAAIDKGLNIHDPIVQATIESAAAADANRGIFMGDNVFSKYLVNTPINALRSGKSTQLHMLADTLEFVMPIVRVSSNIAAHTMRLNPLIGFGEASARLIAAARAGELKDGSKNLSEDDARAISVAFKAGAAGTLLAAYAWLHPNQFGGIYSEEDKKKPAGMKAGELKIMDQTIPAWMNHAPEINLLNTVASSRRVYDAHFGTKPKPGNLADVMAFTTMSPIKDFPMISTWLRIFDETHTMGQSAGTLARDAVIPGIVTAGLKSADKKERSPKTFWEEMEMGIPGLRGNVTEKNPVKPSK